MSGLMTAAGPRAGTPSRTRLTACLLLALLAGTSGVPAARAATNPLPAMLYALAFASAYQVTEHASSTDMPPALESRTIVVVRRGSGFQIHAVEAARPSTAGEFTVVEIVKSGDTVCDRVYFGAVPKGIFSCCAPKATNTCKEQAALSANLYTDAEPIYGEVGEGATITFAGANDRTIGRQRCTGYTFRATAGKAHSEGTVYVAPSGMPCEQDATTFRLAVGPSNGRTMATMTSVTVWSHINDRHLAMPAGVIPAPTPIGTFAVHPAEARVGQLVVLSGRTTSSATILPPFVQMASARLHTVSRPTDSQCGGTAPEPVAFGQVAPLGSSLSKPAPAGTAWKVSFRVPAQLSTYPGGSNGKIPIPPGVYRLVAGFGPLLFCPSDLMTAHEGGAEAATLTVLP